MQNALIIAGQAVVMFILLAVGYLIYKLKMLDDNSTRQLSNITLTVVTPAVIINAYQTEFKPELAKGLLYSMILAFFCQTVMTIIARLAVRSNHADFEVERFAAGYSNCAFMGIPLAEAAFGAEGVFYLTSFITAFNVFMWTHGVVLMGGKQKASPKSLLKIVTSPAIIAIALGLVFFFAGVDLPDLVDKPITYIASMNTPLAMIVSGATIAKAGLLSGLKKPRVYYVQSLKLLVIPLILAAVVVNAERFGVSPLVVRTVLMAASSPTASASIMFAYRFGKNEEYASNHFTFSTVACIITIPLVLTAVGFFEKIYGIV